MAAFISYKMLLILQYYHYLTIVLCIRLFYSHVIKLQLSWKAAASHILSSIEPFLTTKFTIDSIPSYELLLKEFQSEIIDLTIIPSLFARIEDRCLNVKKIVTYINFQCLKITIIYSLN